MESVQKTFSEILTLWERNHREAAFDKLGLVVQLSNSRGGDEFAKQFVTAMAGAIPHDLRDTAEPQLFEAVASLLPAFVAECTEHAVMLTEELLKELHDLAHKRLVLKICLDRLMESNPARAHNVLSVMQWSFMQSDEEYSVAERLMEDYYITKYPEAATNVFVDFLDSLRHGLVDFVGIPWRAKKTAVAAMGRLLLLNPLRAEDIFRVLRIAYNHENMKRSVVCVLGTALQVCPNKALTILRMIRESCVIGSDPELKAAAIHQIPDAIKACPNKGELFTGLLFQKSRAKNALVRMSALRELPRAAKYYRPRAEILVGAFNRAYIKGDRAKRKHIVDGVPDAFEAGLAERQAEKMVDSLLCDCRNDDVELREAAARQLAPCMIAYSARKIPFFTELLRSCVDPRLKVRRVAVEQLSVAARAYPDGAYYCANAAVRLSGDECAKINRCARNQLETLFKACPDSVPSILQNFMEVDGHEA